VIDIVIICTAAFLAGGLNAIAGGGSFLTFPALVFIGIPAIPANATSAVAVFPGYLSGALGFSREIRSFDRKLLFTLLALSVIGGIAGALLLLITPSQVFSFVVPWLLLIATVLFTFDKQIRRWVAAERAGGVGAAITTLAVTTYGGYFNGGMGIVILSLLSGLGYRDINLMNGLKNIMSFILSAASVITFAIAGIVFWQQAVVMMIASTIGGFIGARIARRLPIGAVRAIVIFVGLGMTLVFFVRG
jgi:uncharacterized membrane protein YfcA